MNLFVQTVFVSSLLATCAGTEDSYHPMIMAIKQQMTRPAREVITASGETNDNFFVFTYTVNS